MSDGIIDTVPMNGNGILVVYATVQISELSGISGKLSYLGLFATSEK
jgi:hypothetical protein